MQKFYWLKCCTVVLLLSVSLPVQARTFFVDNRRGSDEMDGLSSTILNAKSGPVFSINRGLELIQPGDSLAIANNGVPYYESLQLVGSRFSGLNTRPFYLLGNNVIIDGSRPLPHLVWKQLAPGLWSFRPNKKTYYQLLRNDEVLPEHQFASKDAKLDELPLNHWGARKGLIYYRGTKTEHILDHDFRFAHHDMGLTLHKVENVVISDITFRYFRIDGVNGHSLCKHLELNNVTSHGNGRSGLFIGGTTDIFLQKCNLKNNRQESLLIRGLAGARLEETELDGKPKFLK